MKTPPGGLREPVTGFLDLPALGVWKGGHEDKPLDVCGFRLEPILFFGRTASTYESPAGWRGIAAGLRSPRVCVCVCVCAHASVGMVGGRYGNADTSAGVPSRCGGCP
jgi:hypothetical protein